MRSICGATMLLAGWMAAAQQPQERAFDAVSVRESEPSASTGGGMRLLPSGDIRVDHLTLANIVGIAHEIDSYRLVNSPDWARSTYYDIVAKANARTTREQTFAMMRAMLVERFNLAAHRETRQVQGFALVRLPRFGPGLAPSAINCEEDSRAQRCSANAITTGSLHGVGMPLATIVKLVSGVVGAPVVDRTNLTGAFDVELRWSRDASPADDTPVMPTALQEQLGLRLQREQVMTEVLVIDHIEHPTAD